MARQRHIQEPRPMLRSAPPPNPLVGWRYLDDGTNTLTGQPGWRVYDGGNWRDEVFEAPMIVGVEWNQTLDTWQRIDRDGAAISLARSWFDSRRPWAGMRRVNLSTRGHIRAIRGDDNYSDGGLQEVGDAVFVGTGSDDLTPGGTFTGKHDQEYLVEIDGVAVVEDCEDAWDESVDANVTSTADVTDYKVGSASAKLDVAAGAAAGAILATEARASLDLSSYTKIALWIKCSVATNLGDLQLLLDDTANCASPVETLDIPALTAGTWTRVELTLANPALDTAIISVGLKYVTDLGACVIHLDDLRAGGTFRWSKDGGTTWEASAIGITESAQELEEGVTVTFGSTMEHTLGDQWWFDAWASRVMVEIPRFYVRSEKVVEGGETKYRWWIADHEAPGFEVHPAFNQRAGDPPAPFIYVGAYEADFVYDRDGAHYEYHSRTGAQPWTGAQIWEVDFDGGANEPAIGDQVSTPNDAAWFIVDYVLTSGAWDGTGVGKIWVRKPGDDTLGWLDNDTITNDTQAVTLGVCEFTGGAKTALRLDIEEARTYAENIGTGWGLMNIWSLAAIQLLFMIEYGNMDSQSNIGRGIVDKAGGIGFNGELTGADSIDSQLAANGTGSGTGTNGLTPIAYRWLENLWGNTWSFIDGYEAVDAEYRILRRDGGWANPGPAAWVASDYETSAASPITSDGFVSNIVYEALMQYLLIPAAVGGSSSTYIPDYFWAHNVGVSNILLAGAAWSNGSGAGLGCLGSNFGVGRSARSFAGRCEFIG